VGIIAWNLFTMQISAVSLASSDIWGAVVLDVPFSVQHYVVAPEWLFSPNPPDEDVMASSTASFHSGASSV
jgi:hypothetical protein